MSAPDDAGSPTDASDPSGPRGSLVSPYEVAGARLEPVYIDEVATDGAVVRTFSRWFDKELGEYCSPAMIDGALRCVPSAASAGAGELFADETCTREVVVHPCDKVACDAGDAPTFPRRASYFVQPASGPSCDGTLFRITSAPLAPAAVYRRSVGGECIAATWIELDKGEVYAWADAERVPASALVSLDVLDRVEPREAGRRLGRAEHVFAWSDGARSREPGWYDHAIASRCTRTVGFDGETACVPTADEVRRDPNAFADDACTAPMFVSDPGLFCGDPPPPSRYLSEFSGNLECMGVRIYERGEPRTQVFERSGGQCRRKGEWEASSRDWFAEASLRAVPLTQFGGLTASVADDGPDLARTGARLRPRTIVETSRDGVTLRRKQAEWFDTKYAATCTPYRLSDGQMRCVPAAAEVALGIFDEPLFSDAACSAAVMVSLKGYGWSCAEEGEPQFFVEAKHSTCDTRRVARRPAETIAAPRRLFAKDGARCVPHPLPAPNEFFDFFAGAPDFVDPGEFVAITKRIAKER
jgi:hypothetical protein